MYPQLENEHTPFFFCGNINNLSSLPGKAKALLDFTRHNKWAQDLVMTYFGQVVACKWLTTYNGGAFIEFVQPFPAKACFINTSPGILKAVGKSSQNVIT